MQPKIWSMIFFLILFVTGPSLGKNFKRKTYGGTELNSEKKLKFRQQNLTKKWKQSPLFMLQQAFFYRLFIVCLWLGIIRCSDQDVQFVNFSQQNFSKYVKGPHSGLGQFLANENLFKMMINALTSPQNIGKTRLISKFMTPQPG